MMSMTRRNLLGVAASGAFAGCASGASPQSAKMTRASQGSLARDVARYVEFGDHRSGGPGDRETASWIFSELSDTGLDVEFQDFTAPDGLRAQAQLRLSDGRMVAINAQPPYRKCAAKASLTYWSNAGPHGSLQDRVVVFDAPHRRHSTLLNSVFTEVVQRCLAENATALVIITNGPSGEATWLNAPADFAAPPLAILSPRLAKDLRTSALNREECDLSLPQKSSDLTARNVLGRRRSSGPSVVLSTPISGWGTCAAERGPGVAIFLALAREIDQLVDSDLDVHCIATSGHELGYLGAHHYMRSLAPAPSNTSLWFHLGAGIAARDWHQVGGGKIAPLPSADAQRFLGATPALASLAKPHFAGLAGLEKIYSLEPGEGAGELKDIVTKGYSKAIGAFGAHVLHHTASDDLRCIEPTLIAEVFSAVRNTILATLASSSR